MRQRKWSVYDRPGYNEMDCDTDGPAFSHYKLDQGPILNKLGRLLLLLHTLGVQSTEEVFSGKAGPYRYARTKKGLYRL